VRKIQGDYMITKAYGLGLWPVSIADGRAGGCVRSTVRTSESYADAPGLVAELTYFLRLSGASPAVQRKRQISCGIGSIARRA
jgi:hypothetical protein